MNACVMALKLESKSRKRNMLMREDFREPVLLPFLEMKGVKDEIRRLKYKLKVGYCDRL